MFSLVHFSNELSLEGKKEIKMKSRQHERNVRRMTNKKETLQFEGDVVQ